MIVLDLSQVLFSTLLASLGNHKNIPIEEDIFRHLALNTIRSINHKLRNQYGELVIASDSRHYWRKKAFPYYKSHRKEERAKSEIDWPAVFVAFGKVKDELATYFPYRFVEVDGAEADDVMGVLARHVRDEPVVIVSEDKDLVQLQAFSNVKQYAPIGKKRFVNEPDPKAFLKKHIICGDRGDGIPNILSPDETFVLKQRQKTMTKKRLQEFMETNPFSYDENVKPYWDRNEHLIDLNNTPVGLELDILHKYKHESGKGRDKLFGYFIEHKLKNLMGSIGEF